MLLARLLIAVMSRGYTSRMPLGKNPNQITMRRCIEYYSVSDYDVITSVSRFANALHTTRCDVLQEPLHAAAITIGFIQTTPRSQKHDLRHNFFALLSERARNYTPETVLVTGWEFRYPIVVTVLPAVHPFSCGMVRVVSQPMKI